MVDFEDCEERWIESAKGVLRRTLATWFDDSDWQSFTAVLPERLFSDDSDSILVSFMERLFKMAPLLCRNQSAMV